MAVPNNETHSPKIDPLSLAYAQDIPVWRQNLSQKFMQGFVGFWGFVGQNWLTILNVVNGFCLMAAFATPLLAMVGLDEPANLLFSLFHYVCVQDPHHSFYIGGRQMCVCQRCMGIYGGLLLSGIVFYWIKNKVEPLKVWQFALIFCPPIAVDGFTQMFGWRESNPELRLLTGGFFAVGAVWVLYPLLDSKMRRLSVWAARDQL